jgi:hypothetical protein
MFDREPEVPEERRIKLRIGVNYSIMSLRFVEDHDIFGDGVSLARSARYRYRRVQRASPDAPRHSRCAHRLVTASEPACRFKHLSRLGCGVGLGCYRALDAAAARCDEFQDARGFGVWHFRDHDEIASAYALKGETERAAAELAEARRLVREDRYSRIARLKTGYLGVPKIRALFEATYLVGLHKAGMPEE